MTRAPPADVRRNVSHTGCALQPRHARAPGAREPNLSNNFAAPALPGQLSAQGAVLPWCGDPERGRQDPPGGLRGAQPGRHRRCARGARRGRRVVRALGHPGGGLYQGRDSIRAFLESFLESWEDFSQETEDVIAGEGCVADHAALALAREGQRRQRRGAVRAHVDDEGRPRRARRRLLRPPTRRYAL